MWQKGKSSDGLRGLVEVRDLFQGTPTGITSKVKIFLRGTHILGEERIIHKLFFEIYF